MGFVFRSFQPGIGIVPIKVGVVNYWLGQRREGGRERERVCVRERECV